MGALAVALRLLDAEMPSKIMRAPQNWLPCAVLLPHVLVAAGHTDHASRQLGPAIMADVGVATSPAGTYLSVQARLSDAKKLQERALAIDEAIHGSDHPEVAAYE